MDSIRASTRLQEEKIESLCAIERESLEFGAEVQRIDGDVADIVRQGKEDFYERFDYLRLESEKTEKSLWEKIKEGFQKACEWCKEHWKELLTGIIVVVSVALACFNPVFVPFAVSVLTGALKGGLTGGIINVLVGKSFWEGFRDGAFVGSIFGMIGGLGSFAGESCKFAELVGGIERFEKIFRFSSRVSRAMATFDLLALAGQIFFPGNGLTEANKNLHNNFFYNAFQFIISAAAVFTGNAYRKMLNGESTCFVAGTMIMTVAGLIAIEQIKAGNLVLATSPDTYETTYKKVVETYVRETKNLIHLLIRDGGHTEKLVTTDTHPFYVSGKGFIPAAELCVGDEVCCASTAGAEKAMEPELSKRSCRRLPGNR